MKLKLSSLLSIGIFIVATQAHAVTMTITSVNRTGSLDPATQTASVNGVNLDASVVNTAFGGTWTEVSHLNASLVDLPLTIAFTSGSWGSNDLTGTWAIDPSFWDTYGSAVLGWHVGQGSGDPDVFMFKIVTGATSGTFSYERLTGGGGGFSNFQLYGSGTPTPDTTSVKPVPDSGTTLVSLGLALLGLGSMRKLIRSKA